MNVAEIVKNTIKEHNLIDSGDRVLVGLSGGADSVALLRCLCGLSESIGFTLACAHVNHTLRETADRDMLFCKVLCEELSIPFFCKTADIQAGAKAAGMSTEAFARNVRYEYFASLGFDKIATAHNKNDVAETLLLNFMRGASLSGLSGIPYRRDNIIRPLLDVKKSEILEFCKENGYEFVTDETNFEEVYTRNKIRLDLIPKIEEKFNPNFVNVAAKNAKLLREDAELLDNIAKKEYPGFVDLNELSACAMPIMRRILQLHWKSATDVSDNLPSAYIEDVLKLCKNAKTGKSVDLPDGFSARCEYGRLIIEKNEAKIDFEYKIYPDKVLNIPEIGKDILIRRCDEKAHFYANDGADFAVRNKRQGDIFYPVGMTGKKKLSDFFTDKKIPKKQRDKIPLILVDKEIAAVGNMRSDRRFADCGKQGYKIEIKENADAQKK